MSKTDFILRDFIQIQPDAELTKLSKREKFDLIDTALQKGDKQKGVVINFVLSSSGRRINNRVYTPRGQQNGVASWLEPYPKPILIHHDIRSDPIGRFKRVAWTSLEDQALGFFKDIRSYMELKLAFDSDEPVDMYEALHKHKLLLNDQWPGLGRLDAKMGITDEQAIEKFMDGRFITLSAGTRTNRLACGVCGSNWLEDDICDHRPGSIEDGKLAVFFTGDFLGVEASVVNAPANSLSQVSSIEFSDSLNTDIKLAFKEQYLDESTIFMTDFSVSSGAPMSEKNQNDTKTEEVESSNEEVTEEVEDSTTEDKVQEDPKVEELLKDLQRQFLALKESIDGLAKEQQKESDEKEEKKEKVEQEENEVLDSSKDQSEEIKNEEDNDVDTSVDDDTFPWEILDLALDSLLGDAKLSSEARKKLSGSTFCGPERSFPVPDCAHYTAAKRLIGRYKGPGDKSKILACVERKGKKLGCGGTESSDEESSNVQRDYEETLRLLDVEKENVQSWKEKLENVLNVYAKIRGEQFEGSDKSLEDKLTWFESHSDTKEAPTDVVENPSEASGQESSEQKLGEYQQRIVSKYQQILDSDGESAAEMFVLRKIAAGHLPKTFDVKRLIEE